jgi:hypothetical protein
MKISVRGGVSSPRCLTSATMPVIVRHGCSAPVVFEKTDTLADRVGRWKQRARGRFVHEHDWRRRARVRVGRQPATAQRHAERLEVAGRHHEPVGGARPPAVHPRSTFDIETPVARKDGKRETACGAGSSYSGQRAHAREKLAKERRDRSAIGVARVGQSDSSGQHPVGLDARGDARQPDEALHKKACRDEQHDGDRGLTNHQHLPQPRSIGCAAAARLQVRARSRPRHVQRRNEAEDHAGSPGKERRERKHRGTHPDVGQAWQR